ncbi:hypothetical protein, conserved [Eimeria maxima]|uniref:Uncharacterized protein n=1 Tax=Eimeria maxima TaxID=5804 RepID=U6MF40_EIMMA|nr:hypothetical protein, conserved [Eimeria maxima]CDJ61054.1 hypothetical protein, conserved [Eimeria maxima]
MGKFKTLVPCLCWKGSGSVTQPDKRQAVGAEPCSQPLDAKCSGKSPSQEPLEKVQDTLPCADPQFAPGLKSHVQPAVAKLVADEPLNDATANIVGSATKQTAGDGNQELPISASASEKERTSDVQLLSQDRSCLEASIPVLEVKPKCHEESRNTSQETTTGNESRVTSSPVSIVCPASTSGGEEDRRTVVSTPPTPGCQERESEQKDVLGDKNAMKDQKKEIHSPSSVQTMGLGTEANNECNQATTSTIADPGTPDSHKDGTGVNNRIQGDQKEDIKCSSIQQTVEKGVEPNTASAEPAKPDDDGIQEALDVGKEAKTNSSTKKRKSPRNRNRRTQGEAKPGQTVDADEKVLAVVDSIVADGESVGVRLAEQPEGESPAQENPGRRTGDAKSMRKNRKKKASKAKGKRRHGRTGRR